LSLFSGNHPQLFNIQYINKDLYKPAIIFVVNNNWLIFFNKRFKLRNFTSNNKINNSVSQLKEGQKAPMFEGVAQDGKIVKLSDFSGKKVILYFYPRDNTPGCTAEACNLRDNYEDLKKKGFKVIGVSPDNEKSHKGFAGKHSLPFILIADPEKKILNLFGAWGERKMYGKTVTGVLRTTFIIDEKGVIEKVISKVDTAKHTEQIFKLYNK
jgi:peroxiredoxin Q/BCP